LRADLPFSDFAWTIEQNATECFNTCSLYRPRCYGAAYNINGTCYIKSDNVSVSDLTTNLNITAGLSNSSQLATPLDISCPYPPNSFQKTEDGMEFEILCDLDMAGYGDYCPSSSVTCPTHTSTMEECMQLCSQSHPLCLGVSWNVDMVAGFANCYLKNAPQDGTPAPDSTFKRHSALTRLSQVEDTCPNNLTYIAKHGQNFTISCWQGRTGTNNITSYHDSDIDSCIDTCANYSGGQDCVGVTFDNSMQSGYENCYLLSHDRRTRA